MNLSQEDKQFAEHWLCFWTTLAKELANPRFGEDQLLILIQYERITRKRPHVLDRLVGRYYKLVRQRRILEILNQLEVENDSFRGYYRGLLTKKS